MLLILRTNFDPGILKRVLVEVINQLHLLGVHLLLYQEPSLPQSLRDLNQISFLIHFLSCILSSEVLPFYLGVVFFVLPSTAFETAKSFS